MSGGLQSRLGTPRPLTVFCAAPLPHLRCCAWRSQHPEAVGLQMPSGVSRPSSVRATPCCAQRQGVPPALSCTELAPFCPLCAAGSLSVTRAWTWSFLEPVPECSVHSAPGQSHETDILGSTVIPPFLTPQAARLRLAAGSAIMKLAQEPCYHEIITPEQFQLCALVINVSNSLILSFTWSSTLNYINMIIYLIQIKYPFTLWMYAQKGLLLLLF